jgi:hypothetical protein
VIPVLTIPAYSRPDLVERCLASVDVDVERLVVVDNSPAGLELAAGGAHVVRPPFASMGYTGSVNFVIGQTPAAPWWAWSSNDVEFGPGDLEAIAALMDAADGPRLVTHGFTWGAINAACVERVGLFDEWSFWPIYFDDTDYLNRCILGGVEWIIYEGGIRHGADGHRHSLTVRSDPAAAAANARSWELNRDAYIAKWGGPPGTETFRTPWGLDLPLSAVRPDPVGRAARSW